MKKMHAEIDNSAGNLVTASQQTLNASAHLSDSSYTQTFSIENIRTEIEHVQTKIRSQKQMSSEASNGIQNSLKTMQYVLEMNLELERKINLINELASGDSVIKPEKIAELIKPATELIHQIVVIMKESASRIDRMSEITNEAFCLSKEQNNSMDAIGSNMEKLDIMAQQATLFSVELTACSELLKEEAEKLKSSTSVFKAND
jgi:methyl-accepting chemotaxis protein